MRIRRFVPLLIAVSTFTGAALAQQPAAGSIVPRIINLPVVNLVSSQTAEVNVVNLAPSVTAVSGALPPESSIASCTGAITFYTSAGNSIGSGTTFKIGTSQIFSASLPYSAIPNNDLVVSNTGRTPVRAVVTINWTVGTSPCTLASNIETYDTATGVTNVHVEGGQATFPFVELLPGNVYSNVYGRTH
jgi:hypothetical protein